MSTIRTWTFACVALLAIVLLFAGAYIAADVPDVAAGKSPGPVSPPPQVAPVFEEEELDMVPEPSVVAMAATMAADDGAAADDVAEEAPSTGRLEVIVVDERGNPVEGADVSILHARRNHEYRGLLSTDETAPGRFELELEVGNVRVAVRAIGYRLADPVRVAVVANEMHSERVTLKTSSTLSGRVVDKETNAPIEGALVRVSGYAANIPAVTGPDGRFELSMLPEVYLYLEARAEGYANLQVGGIDGAKERPQTIELALTRVEEGRQRVDVIGIGVQLRGHEEGIMIRRVYSSSPAEGSLSEGDIILEAEGVALAGMSSRDAISLMGGPEGSAAQLKVKRSDGTVEDVTLERQLFSVERRGRQN